MCYNFIVMDEIELNKTIAQNLCALRKKSGLTQLQLAEKLNYSDKAISKWEKGDCLPSIYVLMTVAEFYNVTIQDIVNKSVEAEPKKAKRDIKTMVSLISWATVWLIATIVFVVLRYIYPTAEAWLAFIVAIPTSFLVCAIFSPQLGQNFALAETDSPHFGQVVPCFSPHSGQNFAFCLIIAPHFLHGTLSSFVFCGF